MSSSPRARRRTANRQRILDEALSMIGEAGFQSLSMHQLADRVDYTPGALYRYFASKDALVAALVHTVLEGVRRRIRAALDMASSAAAPERLLRAVQAYGAFAREEPHHFALLAMSLAEHHVLLHDSAATAPVVRAIIAALQPVAELIEEAQARDLFTAGEAPHRTVLLFASVQGCLLLRKQARVAPDLFDVDALVVDATRTLMLGWGLAPAAVPPR